MRLQVRSHQDFMHGGARQFHFASQGANTPATLSGRLLTDAVLDFFPDLRTILAGAAQAGSILECLQAAGGKTASPFTDGNLRDPQLSSDVLVRLALGRRQNDPGPQRLTLRRGGSFHELLQGCSLHRIQFDQRGDSRHASTIIEAEKYCKELIVRCISSVTPVFPSLGPKTRLVYRRIRL